MHQLIMYHEIHKLKRDGLKSAMIARELGIDRRTIKKYLSMSEEEYIEFKQNQTDRKKLLDSYENFVKSRLENFPEASAAQVYDWLKEHFKTLIEVSEKTVFNFVLSVRKKYDIPKPFNCRDYAQVEELPYGKQAQADFGEYNMTTQDGKRKKIYFFSMVLSRSRQKHVLFRDNPFNTLSAIDAHERSFQYFEGIPQELVYDQDKLMLTDENKGNLILTQPFRQYTEYRKYKLHFCRKADPQSKGKIENVIKYIKYNFLRGRIYVDVDTLNGEAAAWLYRTANAKTHAATRKIPCQEWLTEKKHLATIGELFSPQQSVKSYTVRKDNTIAYKGNFYRLPSQTYQGNKTIVHVKETENNTLDIYDTQNNTIASYKVCQAKGKLIGNNNFKRDYSLNIDELINDLSAKFQYPEQTKKYFIQVRCDNPRYIRDQLLFIRKMTETHDMIIMNQALDFCIQHKIMKATDMECVVKKLKIQNNNTHVLNPVELKTMNKSAFKIIPQKSDISDYNNLMN